jgi:rhodanese-related sulfurtransferase
MLGVWAATAVAASLPLDRLGSLTVHDDGVFDERVAARYDDPDDPLCAPEAIDPVVELLAELADGGSALELAIGTGRIGLPLAARGVDVHGIELSRPMAARLHAKPGGAAIGVTIGDMATTRVPGSFALVYLVFNTIMNLTSQDAQVACFANAAAHLAPGGRFVVEVLVPGLRRLPPGETMQPFHVSEEHIGIDEIDVVTQGLVSHHVSFGDGAAERASVPFRYVWPAELDLMARLAGLSLEHRWGGWTREPFTAESAAHVSVWRRPPEPLAALVDRAHERIRRLTPAQAHEAAAAGALIVDIRSAFDRERDGIVPGSVHIPRTVLEWRLAADAQCPTPHVAPGRELVLLCDHGCSSTLAAANLVELGFADAADVVGGFAAWREAGLPTTRPGSHALSPGELVGMRPPEG